MTRHGHYAADETAARDRHWARGILAATVGVPTNERTLLQCGWFHAAIIEAFAFLLDVGWDVQSVVLHHRGHSVSLRGPRHAISIEYEEDEGRVSGYVFDQQTGEATALHRYVARNGLVPSSWDPKQAARRTEPYDEPAVVRRIRYWAQCIEQADPDF